MTNPVESVARDKKVTIRYQMKTHYPDGSTKERPEVHLSFIYGVERLPPSLERAVEGLGVGQNGKVFIRPEEIYGAHDPSLVREIPKKGLIKQRLKKGQFYRQMKMGSLVSFKVLEIKKDTVIADFNKPMAGIGVSIDLEVLKVEEASRAEIERAMEIEAKKEIGCG
ncbi:MAG: FKBP-type peptidyl-prolyl cis-trans isomerase [Deltaproteobacteria bacterium]|nr:FKBP-type peptidyl-prolyl cis-trans isomerase [Deltaproteobacteria bacterium]